MYTQEELESFRNCFLLKNLSLEQLRQLFAVAQFKNFPKGSEIIREGESADELFLIIQGKVEAIRKDPLSQKEYPIAVVEAGESVGEMALMEGSKRTASVRTLENTRLAILTRSQLTSSMERQPIFSQIVRNMTQQLARRLENMNEFALNALQKKAESDEMRLEVSRFLFFFVVLLAFLIFVFTYASAYSTEFHKKNRAGVVIFPVILLLSTVCIYYIKTSILPLSFYGITLRNWKKSAWEGVLFSIPVLLAMTAIKWALVTRTETYKQLSTIDLSLSLPREDLIFPLIYVLLCPLQELVARGGFQSSIYLSLEGSHRELRSIFLASLMFSAIHAFNSLVLAFFSLILGCLWGWLYIRHKSLIGCSISHMLIGGWSLSILGFGHIFRGQ